MQIYKPKCKSDYLRIIDFLNMEQIIHKSKMDEWNCIFEIEYDNRKIKDIEIDIYNRLLYRLVIEDEKHK